MLGKKVWAIAEGYLPSKSTGDGPMKSHETVCILNPNDKEANVEILIYYTNKDPSGPYKFVVGANRTKHIKFNDLDNPKVPEDTDYSSIVKSDVPIVCQHTRLDSRQAENALLSTMAFPLE